MTSVRLQQNLASLLEARNQVYTTVQTSRSWVKADKFVSALRSYYDSLQPEPLPQISQEHLRRLEQKIHNIEDLSRDFHERLPRTLAIALLGDLLREKLLPPENADENDTLGMLGELVSTITSPGDIGLQCGAPQVYVPRTIRGLGNHLFDGGLVMLEPDDIALPPSMDPAKKESPARDQKPPPLINQKNILTILYPDPKTGELKEGSSSYRIVSLDEKTGEPKPIGKGGTSRVYHAMYIYEGREIAEVALKVVYIQNEKEAEEIKQGFAKGLTLSMKHLRGSQKFVQVYSADQTIQETPSCGMELMKGGSVAGYIQRREELGKPCSLEERLAISAAMSDALAEFQTQFKRVHRDIKPENFLLSEKILIEENQTFLTTPNCVVKLADFDLAEEIQNLPPEPPEELYGTPGYFLMGERDSCRRDVFALASSIYFVMTAERAFQGGSAASTMMNVHKKDFQELLKKLKTRHVPPALCQILFKGLSRNFEERYAYAADVLFNLTTFQYQEMEEAAERKLKEELETRVEERIARETWRKSIREILRELGKLRDKYHLPQFDEKMRVLNKRIEDWEDYVGNEENRAFAEARVAALSGNQSSSIEASRSYQINFYLDDPFNALKRPWKVSILKHANSAGVFEFQNVIQTLTSIPKTALNLPRGPGYSLVFSSPGVMPVHIPGTARPGPYVFRIPVYSYTPELDSCVIIPAGPAIVKEVPGTSHSEKIKGVRNVHHDYAMRSAITHRKWIPFLERQSEKFDGHPDAQNEILKRVPLYWRNRFLQTGTFSNFDDDLYPLDAPVTHVPFPYLLEFFLEMLSLNARPPTLDEWKRAMRGNDARPWPWGTELPDGRRQLIAGCRHTRHLVAVAPLPNGHRGILDYSPFSITPAIDLQPANRIDHIGLNIFKFLGWPKSLEERERMLLAVGLNNLDPNDVTIPDRFVFLAGSPYDAPSPTNLEIIQKQPIDYVGPAGAMVVIPLRNAPPTPSREELLMS